jgi:hypothetical protein
MIAEVFAVQRLLWWALGVALFGYFAQRSINPRLRDAWNSGDKGTSHRRQVMMYCLEYEETGLTLGRIFGRRILYSVLAVLGSGTAFTIYLRPEQAIWGNPVSAGFLLPLLGISVLLFGALLVLGVFSAWELGSAVKHFSDLPFADPEHAARHSEKLSWIAPFVFAIITGVLVIVVALIF